MAPTTPKRKRGSLHNIFENLDISPTKAHKSGSYGSSPKNIVRSLRTKFQTHWPPRGSVRARPLPSNFTVRMDGPYDWYRFEEDPDEIFQETEGFSNEITAMLKDLTPAENVKFEDHLVDVLTRFVFGSNLIENAGASLEITLQICTKIFQGQHINEEISERDQEYQDLRAEMLSQSLGGIENAVIRSRREIVQHARALTYLVNEMVIMDNPLSENMILETHKILTYKVDSSDGDTYHEYGGQYRTQPVGAGFTTFTAPGSVPGEMRSLVVDFNEDLDIASKAGHLDPYWLAAKYCHKFVNIHPFADGNGRTCRLILNAILAKYAGIIVALGEKEEERDAYLEVAGRGSASQQSWDGRDMDDDDVNVTPPPWGELGYLTLSGAKKSMKNMKDALKEKLAK
ncbi:Fic-domain-containing protein [Aureobasidium pullulans]|nr:Fic-domain-containing protein [Aureobasidium pullulans]